MHGAGYRRRRSHPRIDGGLCARDTSALGSASAVDAAFAAGCASTSTAGLSSRRPLRGAETPRRALTAYAARPCAHTTSRLADQACGANGRRLGLSCRGDEQRRSRRSRVTTAPRLSTPQPAALSLCGAPPQRFESTRSRGRIENAAKRPRRAGGKVRGGEERGRIAAFGQEVSHVGRFPRNAL